MPTPFLNLNVPSRLRMDPAELRTVLGSQVEVLGKDLRLILESAEASPNDLLRLSSATAADISNGRNIQGLVTGVSGSRAMMSMVGVVGTAPILSIPTLQPLGVKKAVGVTQPFGEAAIAEDPVKTILIDGPGRPVESAIGYAIGEDRMLFDGTGTAVIHRGSATSHLLVDGLGKANGPSLISGRAIITFTFTAAEQSATLHFPLPVRPDFLSWYNDVDGDDPAFWVEADIEDVGTLTWTYTDAQGVSAVGETQTTQGGFTDVGMPASTLADLIPVAGTVSYATLTAYSGPDWSIGKTSEIVRVVPLCHYRYRQLRRS